MSRARHDRRFISLLVLCSLAFASPAVGQKLTPAQLATAGNQCCDNGISGSSEGCKPCEERLLCPLSVQRAGPVGPVSGSTYTAYASPFGVRLTMSEGFSVVTDSGIEGLGSIPPGCASCGAGGSIPLASQMMRFEWSRIWRSIWTHDGSLGAGMYSGYDFYVVKSASLIEIRDPNTGYIQQFVFSGGSYIPALGVKFRALVTEATATHVTIRQPGGRKLRFEVTGYVQSGANRCRLEYIEDRNGNRITFSYTLPATNTTVNVMKWSSAVDPYGRTTTFSYIIWKGRNVLDRVTLADGRTIDYHYTADNVMFPHKIEYGDAGVPSGIESTWYATNTMKVNEALLPADHYFWEIGLAGGAFGRVRSVKRFDGNYVFARSATVTGGITTTTDWHQNVVREIKHSRNQQLISSRRQLDDGSWETDIDYASSDFLPPTDYVQPASGGVPARTTSVVRDSATDMTTERTYADNTTAEYEYNAFNQMTEMTDRGGDVQQWQYDASGNLLKHTVAVGTAIESDEHWTYNAKGQVLTYEDFNGNVTTYEYYPAAHASQFELEKIILPNGPSQPAGEIVFTYDAFGRIETVTDPVGRTVTFAYDDAGRHISSTYPDTSTETTTYGTGINSARVLETKDRNGNRTVFSYDNTGRVETVQVLESGSNDLMQITTNTYDLPSGLLIESDIDGDITEYEYDYKNRVTVTTVHPSATKSLTIESIYNRYRLETVIDYYGRDTDYTYDNLDRILSTTVELTPGGATITTSTEYDDEGLVTAEIDGNGNRNEYTYDARDRRTGTIIAEGSAVEATTSTTYDDNSNVITRTDERNHDWVMTYSVRNRVLTSANPEGDTTTTTYTADTLVATVTNANAHVTTNTYEACCARLEKQTDDDGFFNTFEYDFNGNLTKRTDESNRVVTYEYDGLDRKTKQTVDPGGLDLITTTSYDITPTAIGQSSTTVSPAGQSITTALDGLNRTSVISGDTAKISHDYDTVISGGADDGLVQTTTHVDPDNIDLTTSVLIDGAGRTIKFFDGFNNADVYTYDDNSNVLTMTDRDGQITTNTYDARDRAQTTEGDSGGIAAVTTLVYDATSNVTQITDAQSKVTVYTYDDANRRLTTTYASGTADVSTWTVTYKPLGQIATLTKPNGIVIEYSYEDRELLSQRVYKQGMVVLGTDTFTYHPNRLLKAAHGGLYNTDLDRSVLNTSYDMANRLIQEQRNIGAGLKTLSYTYAADSLISQMTYPGGTQCAKTYNAHRLLHEVKIGGTTQATCTYDTADRETNRVYVNGTDTTWTLDANSRVTKLKHATTAMMPVTFQEWDYRYSANDDLLVQDDLTTTIWGEAYQYDGLHRLNDNKRGTVAGNTVPTPTHAQNWTLTKVGDWSSWTNGPVGTPVTETRTHNNIHALTNRSTVANPQTYDANFNQTDDGANYLFIYDANDQLQEVQNRTTLATIVEYRYDSQGRRVEKNVGGTIARFYCAGPQVVEERDGADATTAFYAYGSYIDEPLLMDRGGTRHFYHCNRMYTTYVMTDATGAVAERYAYTPYGVVTTYDAAYANPQTTSRIDNPYTFTGRRLDNETLLMYFRVRTYDTVEGRFKQLDHSGYVDGLNLYEYVTGRPTGYVDPFGLCKVCDVKLIKTGKLTDYDAEFDLDDKIMGPHESGSMRWRKLMKMELFDKNKGVKPPLPAKGTYFTEYGNITRWSNFSIWAVSTQFAIQVDYCDDEGEGGPCMFEFIETKTTFTPGRFYANMPSDRSNVMQGKPETKIGPKNQPPNVSKAQGADTATWRTLKKPTKGGCSKRLVIVDSPTTGGKFSDAAGIEVTQRLRVYDAGTFSKTWTHHFILYAEKNGMNAKFKTDGIKEAPKKP